MDRYILRFTGQGATPDADLARIRSAPGITILDSALPRMLLVQASAPTVRDLTETLPGWAYSCEQMIPLPDPRPKIRSS